MKQEFDTNQLIGLNKTSMNQMLNEITFKEQENIHEASVLLNNALSDELMSIRAVRKLDELPKRMIKHALINDTLISVINVVLFTLGDALLPYFDFNVANVIGAILGQVLVNNAVAFSKFREDAKYNEREQIRNMHKENEQKSDEARNSLKNSYILLINCLKKIKDELINYKNSINYADSTFIENVDQSISCVEDRIKETESKMRLELNDGYLLSQY